MAGNGELPLGASANITTESAIWSSRWFTLPLLSISWNPRFAPIPSSINRASPEASRASRYGANLGEVSGFTGSHAEGASIQFRGESETLTSGPDARESASAASRHPLSADALPEGPPGTRYRE